MNAEGENEPFVKFRIAAWKVEETFPGFKEVIQEEITQISAGEVSAPQILPGEVRVLERLTPV